MIVPCGFLVHDYLLLSEPLEELRKTYKSVLKFYDHSNLAIQQQKLVSKKRGDLEDEVAKIVTPKISEITKEREANYSV